MDNYFSKIFTILLLAVLLCVVPAFYITMLTDYTNTVNESSKTRALLDKILLTGEVKEEDFESSDITIEVFRDTYILNEDGEYELRTVSYTEDSLIDKQNVKLEVGDIVVITNKCSGSNTGLFLKFIFGTKLDDVMIRLAGVCKNESY
ncbi:MAG: hypothetical protein MJ246_05475 [Clostridia bacterium]|nr:hypothetical protein [Clostridia bacterium]